MLPRALVLHAHQVCVRRQQRSNASIVTQSEHFYFCFVRASCAHSLVFMYPMLLCKTCASLLMYSPGNKVLRYIRWSTVLRVPCEFRLRCRSSTHAAEALRLGTCRGRTGTQHPHSVQLTREAHTHRESLAGRSCRALAMPTSNS
jgi:hypothetical protein